MLGSEITQQCRNESAQPEKGGLNVGVHATITPDERDYSNCPL